MLTQKGFAHIFVIIILLLGLAAGFYLVNYTRTNLKPKANEDNIIQIVDKDGNPITETNTPNVYLKIKLPPGWELPNENNTKDYPQDPNCPVNRGCCAIPTQTCSVNDDCQKNGYNWCYNGYCIKNDYNPKSNTCPGGESSTPKVVKEVQVYNDRSSQFGYSNGGSDGINLDSNFDSYLDRVISWNLDQLFSDQNKYQRDVVVLFISTKFDYVKYQSSVTLTRPKPSAAPSPSSANNSNEPKVVKEYSVNFYIHEGLNVYKSQVESWVRSSIEEINLSFKVSRINKMLKIGRIDNFGGDGCPSRYGSGQECSTAGLINVYIYPPGLRDDLQRAWAWPTLSVIGMQINYGSINSYYTDVLAHEVGHMFVAPDYYLEAVSSENNPIAHMDILPYGQDVMYYNSKVWTKHGYSYYSDLTKYFMDKFMDIPITAYQNPLIDLPRAIAPGNIILQITNNDKTPIEGVKIEVFPEIKGDKQDRLSLIDYAISPVSSYDGYTDKEGKFVLGNNNKIFQLNDKSIYGFTSVIRITKDNEERFMALTRSYLNYLYFKGQFSEALISTPFSSLVQYKTNAPVQTLSVPGMQLNIKQTEGENTLPLNDNFDYINESSEFIQQ